MPIAPTQGSLNKLSIPGCTYEVDSPTGNYVLNVLTPHALTQAAGYLKFINGPNRMSVFFRGQAKLYAGLPPTLTRGLKSQKSQSDRIGALRKACGEISKANKIFDSIPFEAHEPLLQHYGLKTTWVDLVDNIWVALWFACHHALAVGPLGDHLHFEQRNPFTDPSGFAYVLLITAENTPSDPYVPGLYRGAKTELIDLRVATPSIFLRPHAQHGVLFRMRGDGPRRPVDYSPQISDIIRINLRDALTWLGSGTMTGTHALFPPAYYDRGYEHLLTCGFVGNKSVGAIHHIGT